jgi:hypothetical protein
MTSLKSGDDLIQGGAPAGQAAAAHRQPHNQD